MLFSFGTDVLGIGNIIGAVKGDNVTIAQTQAQAQAEVQKQQLKAQREAAAQQKTNNLFRNWRLFLFSVIIYSNKRLKNGFSSSKKNKLDLCNYWSFNNWVNPLHILYGKAAGKRGKATIIDLPKRYTWTGTNTRKPRNKCNRRRYSPNCNCNA
jgi:hypothetical protein